MASTATLVTAAPAGPLAAERDHHGETHAVPPILLQYWHSALRWRWLIAGIVLAALAAGVLITLLTPPKFTARTEVEISREQKNVTNVEGIESQQENREQEFYATQYTLLKANSLAERVARRLNLARSDAFFEAHGVKPGALPRADGNGPAAAAALKQRERAVVGLLLSNISIEPVRTSRLVDVKYTSRNPQLSAQIANVWVQEFIGSTMDRGFASTADARRFLEQRLAVLRQKLEQSERDAVQYASNSGIVTLDSVRDADGKTTTQRTLASSDLEALNQALIAARAERIGAQSRAGAGSAESSPEVLSNPAITTMRAQRAQLAAQYAQTLVRFDPRYPAAVALRQQIGALDAAIARETSRVGASRALGYREAVARETDLAARVEGLKREFDRQRQASIQYNIYQRDADTNRQLYDALLQRYKEIGIAGTVGASNIAIVDEAKAPTTPSSPNLMLNLAIALLAGAGLAAMTVLALEQIDEGVRGPADVQRFLKVPLLGSVPLSEDDPILTLQDPKSHLAEAYFSLRSTLAFSTDHGLPRSFAVTSTRPSEGKSTTALALAEVIGRTGKRVLLVDADLRSPSLHRYLEVPNEGGFSNLLVGDDNIASLIRQTTQANLWLLTCGPTPPSPAELLSSDRVAEVVRMLTAQFDHVIFDAPPVLGLADAPLIGRALEGVLFVVEAEKTPRRAAAASLERLRSIGNHVFGVVVSKIDSSRHSYGYGYGYGYGYDYKYGEEKLETGKLAAAR
jgi:succinoglycan biosynthesis transport protein ExoP